MWHSIPKANIGGGKALDGEAMLRWQTQKRVLWWWG
jgi:hypothetical protein